MISYWFVCYTIRYINIARDFCEIKGNSVHMLPSESFLPGTVRKVLIESHIKQMSKKILSGHDIDIVIENFGAISREGFENFDDSRFEIESEFKLFSKEFVHTSMKITKMTSSCF